MHRAPEQTEIDFLVTETVFGSVNTNKAKHYFHNMDIEVDMVQSLWQVERTSHTLMQNIMFLDVDVAFSGS